MSSIKVALRARPWTLDDRLGIDMQQVDADSGTITLLNSDYSTKFFSFSYSWWTAFNYKHHCDEKDMETAANMHLVSQDEVYASVGQKIKADLYDGNAVVLFAYGLSGSGKTFTVFGMDDVKNKSSWFYHETPDKNWGVFPRLGYDIFMDRKDGWKVTMKYFQNVVDIVRDLMSPDGAEKIYKEGMRKDADGFMDIEWCGSAVLNSWGELRKTFLAANSRKAIAPTQFNHQSTRGHCIMTIEVLMPDVEDPSIKKRGRVYVCDLAGTEPAGDIYYAMYKPVEMSDGTMEVKLIGAHPDQKKTQELQNQGKKINLSLSEMAQFFMKMAEAFKAKKLKPGFSIPGCNTYFLCKYLKDTMLNAKTYLFCAIRPEVTYLKYTFATLGFAKNASVVQLAPKKATTNASPAERKLMAELEKYKQMVEQLKTSGGGGGGGGGGDGDEVKKLQEMLAEQQAALQKVVNEDTGGGDQGNAIKEEQEKKRKQYAQRGIALAESVTISEIATPYFINIDEDEFRTKRYLYILKAEGDTVFGPGGDMRPPSFSVKKNHCTVTVGAETTLKCGEGVTWACKRKLATDESVVLTSGDWVLMGSETLQYFAPGAEKGPDAYSPEDTFGEIFEAQSAAPKSDGSGDPELAKRIAELEAQKTELQAANEGHEGGAAAAAASTSFDEAEVMTVINLIREVRDLCVLFDRSELEFEPVLARQDSEGGGGQGRTFIKVTHSKTKQTSLISDADFHLKCSVLNDEKLSLMMSFESGEEYTTPEDHDPIALFFGEMYHIASGRHFCEYLAYNFETEPEDKDVNLVASASPYHNSGILNIDWSPVGDEVLEISDIKDLIGKPWRFKIHIQNAAIKIRASQCYVSYTFPDESGGLTKYTTDVAQQDTMTPNFDYEFVHEISCVTQLFVDFVAGKNGMDFEVYASPVYKLPPTKISTSNAEVAKAFNANVVLDAGDLEIVNLRKDKEMLALQLEAAIAEIAIATGEEVSKVKSRLIEAKVADANANPVPVEVAMTEVEAVA